MFFTREDIDKIYQGLLARGIKDSEFPETNGVKVDDTLAIIQDGENKQINVREFLDQISLWKKESFINITDTYNKSNITLADYLKEVRINVDDKSCTDLTTSSLYLYINATDKNNKTINYQIPLSLNSNCD